MAAHSLEIEEAREALEFWSKRAERLPWHRRAARREAREMATRWRSRLIRAHLDRWRLGAVSDFVSPFLTRPRKRVRRSTIGRMMLIAVASITAACVAMSVLVVAAVVHLVAAL